MYGSRKPDNWYQMDYHERQAWERQEQERQDLEYDKQRAQEDATQAQNEARRSRLNAQREMAAMSEDYGILQDELSTMNVNYERILADRNDLKSMLKEILDWFDANDPNYAKSDWAVRARALLDRARGD